MKSKWIIIEIAFIAISILDVTFKITDQIKFTDIQMIIGILIKLCGIVSFIALLAQLSMQGRNHEKKIKAIIKFYQTRIDWLESNTKTHYEQAFNEIDKIIKLLPNVNISVEHDPKILPIKEKFREEMNKALIEFNEAFKDWGEEYKIINKYKISDKKNEPNRDIKQLPD
jgi:hypothetical protein